MKLILQTGNKMTKLAILLLWVIDQPQNVISQIDKEEVSLRRVIGAKKDQYFLDKKMVT